MFISVLKNLDVDLAEMHFSFSYENANYLVWKLQILTSGWYTTSLEGVNNFAKKTDTIMYSKCVNTDES